MPLKMGLVVFCLSWAGLIAVLGREGWGWFLFAAILFGL
jgi:hypothetical protein